MNKTKELSPLESMIRTQVIDRGVDDAHVIEAMRRIPRDKFFPRGSADNAYADQASPIGHGQTISQPYMVALMTHHLDLRPSHKVLEVGTGSGYQTALLSRLADQVYSVERVKPLLDGAFERLMDLGLRNVHFKFGDGTLGWPEQAPFDRILIAAGAPELPRKLLLSQLKEGGKAVLPVGPSDQQMLVVVTRVGDELITTDVCACRFVRLVGEEGWAEGK
ncbi:MAG TPA: protein-L-isoaspartate(D-aspartate) O-methyltransferase [Tepidisphaeraceae bacterium]|nr:protein-L-isoaspartate(D-aspartate) O-methyltransferase [Tepidisphaeraceae bacterium]